MILKAMDYLFGLLIGRLPKAKRDRYWSMFKDLMVTVAKEVTAESLKELKRGKP